MGNVEAMEEKITDGTREWNLDGEISFKWKTGRFFFMRKEKNKLDICRVTYVFEGSLGISGSLLSLSSMIKDPLVSGVSLTITAREAASSREPALFMLEGGWKEPPVKRLRADRSQVGGGILVSSLKPTGKMQSSKGLREEILSKRVLTLA